MSRVIDTGSAEWRMICEARSWLRQYRRPDGQPDTEAIAGLKARIAQRRGMDNAEALLAEMRRQWKRRDDWLVTRVLRSEP